MVEHYFGVGVYIASNGRLTDDLDRMWEETIVT